MGTTQLHRQVRALVTLLGIAGMTVGLLTAPNSAYADDGLLAGSPTTPLKLAFVHHSVGENWLTDDQGALGRTLDTDNYFVSDTNYGWGPDSIGDRTDIPNWPEWFTGPDSPTYLSALYTQSDQNSSYTRTLVDPGGENDIIMFKSCYPNSSLAGNPNDPPAPGTDLTVANAKYAYNQLLAYFATRPDKLFVVITAPPNSETEYGTNARAFNNWLRNNWLAEGNYALPNVAVFDFYNVLSGPDNHHRMVAGVEQHVYTPGMNNAYYRTDPGNDHPNVAGSQKATTEFVPMLNHFVARWQSQTQPPAFVARTPIRVADTRPGEPVVFPTDKLRIAAGGELAVPVSGANGVPLDAVAVALNVTVVAPAQPGFLTVYPCGAARPNASNLNHVAGQVVPNAVVTAVGTGGRICVFSQQSTHVVIDLGGWFPAGRGFTARPPVRLADSRSGEPVLFPSPKVRLPAGGVMQVPVAGANWVAADATAASLNVTAVGPALPGFLTVYPCGAARPNASNLNYVARQTVPNAVLSRIGTQGKVCIFSQQDTDVVVDLGGWFAGASGYTAQAPVRVADTRFGEPVVFPETKIRVHAGGTLEVPVAAAYGVPTGASAVSLNVTVVGPSQPGFLTVFPCGVTRPNASNLNYVAGQIVPNAVLSGVGTGGRVCVFAQQETDVVVDLGGWFPAA